MQQLDSSEMATLPQPRLSFQEQFTFPLWASPVLFAVGRIKHINERDTVSEACSVNKREFPL